MMRLYTLIMITFWLAAAHAQQVKKVTATTTYYADAYQTLEQAKIMAVQQAQIEAIKEAFGTGVSQSTTSVLQNSSGRSKSDFLQLNESEARGIWLEDLAAPMFNCITHEQNMLVVNVTVKGAVREITTSPIRCNIKILCEGIHPDNERTDFKSGNDLFLSFTSPIDGYLVVYLLDNNQDAFCALPYYNQSSGAYRIMANKEYILFSELAAQHTPDEPYVEEYALTTEQEVEINQLYVIFSPNKFTKPVDVSLSEDRPRQLDYANFQKWLSKCRKHDYDMIVEKTFLYIRK